MRKNIAKVIAAFERREATKGDSKNTCHTNGHTIFSYALPIATRLPDGGIWIRPEEGQSRTTKQQIRAVHFMLRPALIPRCLAHDDCREYRTLGEACAAQE